MLVDALTTIALAILNVLAAPLAPLFTFVPSPDSVLGGVPTVLTAALSKASVVLYYLNLGPALTFATTLVAGALGVRVSLIAFDIILPPIPVVGKIYSQLMNIIRGV